MADIKIIDLPEKTDNPSNDDLLVIEDQEDTKKITLQKLRGALSMDNILSAIKESLENKIIEFLEVHSNRMKELEKKNYDLETLCHNLENDHDHDAERIAELEEQLHDFKQREQELVQVKNTLTEKVVMLEEKRALLEEQIQSLTSELAKDEKSMVILQSKVKDLQLKVTQLKKMNDELEESIREAEKNFDDTNIQQFESANKMIDESISDLKTMIRYYHPDVVFD